MTVIAAWPVWSSEAWMVALGLTLLAGALLLPVRARVAACVAALLAAGAGAVAHAQCDLCLYWPCEIYFGWFGPWCWF